MEAAMPQGELHEVSSEGDRFMPLGRVTAGVNRVWVSAPQQTQRDRPVHQSTKDGPFGPTLGHMSLVVGRTTPLGVRLAADMRVTRPNDAHPSGFFGAELK